MSKKKKLLFQTDYSLAKTGFGRNAKILLEYLHRTDKYDLVHYVVGLNYSNPELARTPWKSVGCLPDDQREMQELQKDPNVARLASYGANYIDRVIKDEKPDVYIATQDIWGVDFAIGKKWWNKITSVIWTTLDSLPILPTAIEKADKIKNYWIWSNFAVKALHKLGHKQVKQVSGVINEKEFYRLEDSHREKLRKTHKIPKDAFVVGYVFRNQLRKSVPNLLQGYKKFKEANPDKKTFLLLHTHFGEGWNIHRLADEHEVNKNEILTTYLCKACLGYEVKPFTKQDLDCKLCSAQKSQVTTSPQSGVDEPQLNEIYNLMDVYCHPFTSGGQEIPIQEAKLTELVTLVTSYSCGEDLCIPEACSLPLDWAEYREPGTEFIKASTFPESISKQLQVVLEMSDKEKAEIGKKAREWTIENYSINNIGPFFEKFIDESPFTDYDFSQKEEQKDPHYRLPEGLDDRQWVLGMYHNILKMRTVDEEDEGFQYWMKEIEKGAERSGVENYFRQVAAKENSKNEKVDFEASLGKDGREKRVLYVMPQSIGDIILSTGLFRSLKKQYPNYNLYVATQPEYHEILEGNPHIHKLLDYTPQMDSLTWLEGSGDHEGYFEIAFLPHLGTQRMLSYLHNGKDKIAYEDLCYEEEEK
jgi:glycosyltransferase involved in cell wall biosynthesis